MSKPTIQCKNCNKECKKSRASSKYCSRICYFSLRKSCRSPMICLECNKEYFVNPARYHTSKYCSLKCTRNSSRVEKMLKVCIQCKNEYRVYKKDFYSSRFCSFSCHGSWRVSKINEDRKIKYKKESPEETEQKMKESFERFFEKTEGCWEWKGSKRKDGFSYGKFTFRGKRSMAAHRVSYELYNGKIPKGKIIMHLCDNPSCVKNTHLKIGTHSENTRDMIKKGRSKFCRNSINQVKEIKKLLRDGMSGVKISKKFGVSRSLISLIKLGKTWGDVNID